MARLGVFRAALGLCLAATACGDRAGDPVVALAPLSPPEDGDGGSTPEPALPRGLCSQCDSHDECGDDRDLCIDIGRVNVCGRNCKQSGCPRGYQCVFVTRDDAQCVPESHDCSHVVSHESPSLDTMRATALAELNHLRAELQLAPFVLDDCLNEQAWQSATQLARTGDLLGKFEDDCEQFQPAPCTCGWRAQSEISVTKYSLTWEYAIDRSIDDRWHDGNESFVRNVSEPEHTRIGFGILLSGDEAWTAISFGVEP